MKYNTHIFLPFFIGSALLSLLSYFLNLVETFGKADSYVYYYTFSTIAQSYFALIAFIGALAVFKWQRDEKYKDDNHSFSKMVKKSLESQRDLSFKFKMIAVCCIWNVGFALIGILLIPLLNVTILGPIWIGGNIILSLWILILSYSIIQIVLRLDPN